MWSFAAGAAIYLYFWVWLPSRKDVDPGPRAAPSVVPMETKPPPAPAPAPDKAATEAALRAAAEAKAAFDTKQAERAAMLLQAARGQERAGMKTSAIYSYRRVVDAHPGTPEAEEAARRVEALTGPMQERQLDEYSR